MKRHNCCNTVFRAVQKVHCSSQAALRGLHVDVGVYAIAVPAQLSDSWTGVLVQRVNSDITHRIQKRR